MTNTHVVVGLDRMVVANKTIGVKSAHVLYRGMSKLQDGSANDRHRHRNPGDGRLDSHGAHLPFAEGVEEGEAITIGGYPGRASEHQDMAYDTVLQPDQQNSLPTPETIPNVKFDFGFVQSVFVRPTQASRTCRTA